MTQINTMLETVRGLFDDSTLLVRQEIELAKAEAGEKVEQAKAGISEVAAGAILALVALFILAQALVAALSNLIPPSLAALAVGLLLALVAWICLSRGEKNLRPENLAPKRTARSVQRNVQQVREAV